ncbi:MAG: porin family protein [Prolixibacteraceae bacterium]|jgi:hypothetical protein|nr:porin family protein [Prolixibacteraceae bacterium]
MKRIILITGLLVFTYALYSQSNVNLGIKYGQNSSVMITNIEQLLEYPFNEEQYDSYHVGAFARLNLKRFSLQPEIYFNNKGGIVAPASSTSSSLSPVSFKYQTVDVPVLAGFSVINRKHFKFRLTGGPVFSYITANNFFSDISALDKESFQSQYMGMQFGAGIDILFLTLDARFEQSANIINSSSEYEAKNRVFLISAGIKLF